MKMSKDNDIYFIQNHFLAFVIYFNNFTRNHFHTKLRISTESSFHDEKNQKKKYVEISTSSGAIPI